MTPESLNDGPETNPLGEYFDSHLDGRANLEVATLFFDIYHRHLPHAFASREVHVLEIGVYSGGSLGDVEKLLGPARFDLRS